MIKRLIQLIQILIVGWVILAGAIALNFLSRKVGIVDWYDFMQGTSVGFVDYLWLFLIYPGFLGILGYVAVKYLKIGKDK